MTSIRRTLLLNVLLLLVVTLGTVSYFVYRTSEGALRERQRTARELVELRYADRQDDVLRSRAEELAGEVQANWNRDKFREQWIASELAAVLTPMTPAGPAPLIVRVITSMQGPIGFEMNVRLSTEVKLDEDSPYGTSVNSGHEYVQLATESGATWTSRSLAGHQFPLDESAIFRDESDAATSPFDTLELPNGPTVRRLVLRSPVTRFSHVGSFWLPRPPRTEESLPPSRALFGLASVARSSERRPTSPVFGPPPSASNPAGYSLPNFYLHCAWSPDNPRLGPLIAERDAQLHEIDSNTDRNIRSLRSTLAWGVIGAIAATLLGGYFLVGYGLFPLKRLSFAVSQITPKDLRLPIEPGSLPAELQPVTHKLVQALVELQKAFDREKRAAADISHELRTPLAALTTTIEVGCRKTRTAEQYRQSLEDCRGIAKQMSLLVERMLTIAWIDADVDQMQVVDIEVGELLSDVTAIGRPLAESRGLSFRVNLAGSIRLRTDPDKLREVMMNLIHNAIEYNRPGGSVELAVRATSKHVVLEVRDTGIGMSADIRDKIFERFFRGDPSRHSNDVHAGLGLAIVKEYVDRLGGTLSVESDLGVGSRFRIELPQIV